MFFSFEVFVNEVIVVVSKGEVGLRVIALAQSEPEIAGVSSRNHEVEVVLTRQSEWELVLSRQVDYLLVIYSDEEHYVFGILVLDFDNVVVFGRQVEQHSRIHCFLFEGLLLDGDCGFRVLVARVFHGVDVDLELVESLCLGSRKVQVD